MSTSLRARDLMTAEVVTVPPETPVMAIARLLAERGISAVPVVDAEARLKRAS
jgi:CBS domain-containing protein